MGHELCHDQYYYVHVRSEYLGTCFMFYIIGTSVLSIFSQLCHHNLYDILLKDFKKDLQIIIKLNDSYLMKNTNKG